MPTVGGAISQLGTAFEGKSYFGAITWLFIIVIFAIIGFIIGYMILRKRTFKYKIVIFEKINGQFEPTRKDRAREVKLGRGGHVALFLAKHKVYRARPKLQSGRKVYWYFIAEDGEWINFNPGDFDKDRRSMGAHIVDADMRYANEGLERSLRERYDKSNVWQQYGIYIVSVGFIVVVGIMTWLLFDKWIELAGTTNAGVKTAGEVMELAKQVLSSVDNIKSCSGIVPAT